jgi:predicted ArsR family transcriptional regulator
VDPAVRARREQQILEYIKTTGGATCWEIENALGLLHQSASATITRLRNAGHLVDTGERRPTNTGRMATVWGATY